LWAVNTESGFFGVAPGTNSYTNPNAMKTIERDTIYTNVLLTPDNTVWWEDGEGDPPPSGINWQGLKWRPGMRDEDGNPVYGAHPNSRYTAPIANCPVAAEAVKTGAAVKIDAILFGGRRARLAPLAYQAFDWNHGVFIGASMASERTAAQFGKLGEVRRDPMAMLPFCGYNMADYWAHWLRMGSLMKNPPKIFNVNWFRLDDNGKFIWPGFGENLRVLDWVLKRCDGAIDALETPIGWLPRAGDIDAEGLNLPAGDMEKLLEVPKADWHGEAEAVGKYFEQFGDRTPKALYDQLDALKSRLGK